MEMQETAILAFLRFEQPLYLWLLLLIPLIVVMALRSLSGLDPVRRVLAILFRVAVIVLATFALAGASRVKTTDDLTVLFLMDRSNSVPRGSQRQAFDRVQDVADAETRKRDDRIGVVAFDGVASVEQLPMSALAVDRVGDAIDPDRTDIAAALRLSMALFPPDAARRVVVVSDGNENFGEALREADNLRAARVPIDVIPVSYQLGEEVVFEQLRTPPTAASDETINVQMVLRAQVPTSGRVVLYHNDRLVDFGEPGGPGFPVTLDAGSNRIIRKLPLRTSGAHRFRALFQPDNKDADTIAANNEGTSFTVVSGPGKVLILTTQDDMNLATPSAVVLQSALAREKLTSDIEVAGSQPIDQVRLLEYSLVILDNVPRNDLSEDAAKAISAFVRDTGGGLIMLGGDQSFGAGGWMDSPIEEIMPVSFEIKNKKQFPKGALVLVMHACEVPNGNFIGERCAVSAIKTLSTRDLVGVLSYRWTGDQNGFWDIPLQTVGNKTTIIQKVLNMQMGDMPDLQEVMKPGVDALANRKDAAVKHMIIVSDFDPMPPTQALIDKMTASNITCSTVAIGYGGHQIDESKAKWIASATGGKFYK
ncbi:MAG: VWA domain-containing protein, partial [Phycisphaerae bacterium]